MQIGMVTACYYPVINGVTRMVDQYSQRLRALGHDVTIFTLGISQPGDEPHLIRSGGLPLGQTGYFAATRYDSIAQKRLAQMDIVHCHHLFMSVEFARKYTTAPIIYTNHTRYDLYTKLITKLPKIMSDGLLRLAWPRFAAYANHIIAPSAHIKTIMQQFGVATPIAVIPNGVNLDCFARSQACSPHPFSKEHRVGLYIGRISAEKSPFQLIQQFHAAYQRQANLRLVIVGDGPARHQLLQAIQTYDLANAIHYAGAVLPSEVPSYLHSADFFVTASRSEVHPLTVIEALAAGLPVVAYDCAGISETVISAENGLLAQQDHELSSVMVRLAQDDVLRLRLGQAATVSAERFNIDHTIERTLSLYDYLLCQRDPYYKVRL